MMTDPYVRWSSFFEIGVPAIDRQHQQLVEILNEFNRSVIEGHDRESVFKTLNSLVKYVELHFGDEEKLMAESRYPELAKQKIDHEKLTLKIFDLAREYQQGEARISQDVLDFIKSWLVDHILREDKKIADYLIKADLVHKWQ